MNPTIHNECLTCGGRKLRTDALCPSCLTACTTIGAMVRVKEDSPNHPGRVGWVAGVSGDSVQIRLNLNGTKWFRVERKWLLPMVGE